MRCAANAVYHAACQMERNGRRPYVCCVSQQIQVQDPHSSAGIATAAAMHLTRMNRNVKMRGRPLVVQALSGLLWSSRAGLSWAELSRLSWSSK